MSDRNQDNNFDDQNFDEDKFVHRARELLASEAENLNAPVRSKLTQARHAALDELPLEKDGQSHRWRGFIYGNINWAPAGAAILVAGVAIVWWVANPGLDDPALIQTAVVDEAISPDDFDMLMHTEGIELLADLDFYTWIEAELPDGKDTAG